MYSWHFCKLVKLSYLLYIINCIFCSQLIIKMCSQMYSIKCSINLILCYWLFFSVVYEFELFLPYSTLREKTINFFINYKFFGLLWYNLLKSSNYFRTYLLSLYFCNASFFMYTLNFFTFYFVVKLLPYVNHAETSVICMTIPTNN